VFRGPKTILTGSNVAMVAANLLVIVAELWAKSAT
jgi:hypothetical protein